MAAYTKADAVPPGFAPAACFGSWDETSQDNVIRSEMDNGAIKSRRRFTGVVRMVSVSVTMPGSDYTAWKDWYFVTCQQGARPTVIRTPYGANEVWCFSAPPQFSWPASNAFTMTASFYQIPAWA